MDSISISYNRSGRCLGFDEDLREERGCPLPSEYGTYKTVKAI